jgi:hypothetical protein
MDWEHIQANWRHFKVLARLRWAKISAAQFDLIGGRRDVLVGQLHEVYGISVGMAQMQVESWQGQQREPQAGSA